MVEVMKICPLRLYITQTSCKLSAVHRYLIARIPNTYFIWNGGLCGLLSGGWTYEVRCVCKRVFDIDMGDRNLPQTASKQGYFYRKTVRWKPTFKTRPMCLNVLMFYLRFWVLRFSYWKFLTFDFIIYKIWRYILGIVFTNWKPCMESWSEAVISSS
jgi:hypothetical protein